MEKTKLGLTIKTLTPQKISLVRETAESQVEVTIEDTKRRDYQIKTGNTFFDHMLTGIGSRACLNIDATYERTKGDAFNHVIAEDVGLTFGRAIREMLDIRRSQGVNERGSYTIAFDEALVAVTLAFDGRAYTFYRGEVPGMKLEWAENILATDLKQFFEGFAQGSGCVVQIQFFAGDDSHHTWEATFKAFGEALRESLSPCPYRAGTTIGLKGTGMERKL